MAFSSRYLTPILSSFAVRYPSLRLDIEYGDRYVNLQGRRAGFQGKKRSG